MMLVNDAISVATMVVADDGRCYWIRDSQWLLAIGLLHLSKQGTSLEEAIGLFADKPPDLDAMGFDGKAGYLVDYLQKLRSQCPKQFCFALTHAVACSRRRIASGSPNG